MTHSKSESIQKWIEIGFVRPMFLTMRRVLSMKEVEKKIRYFDSALRQTTFTQWSAVMKKTSNTEIIHKEKLEMKNYFIVTFNYFQCISKYLLKIKCLVESAIQMCYKREFRDQRDMIMLEQKLIRVPVCRNIWPV